MSDSKQICVGLDPSLTGFGICVLAGEAMDSYVIESKKLGDTMHERIARYEWLCTQVIRTVSRHGQPSIVLLEGYSYGSPARAVPLGEFGSLLRRRLRVQRWTAVEVAPTTLKKFATGKGSGKKLPGVPTHLTNRYGVMFGTTDEYDAFALAKMGQCILGEDEPQTKPQSETVETVKQKWLAELEAASVKEQVA